tara:strand:- start:2264 stop:2854 length:591 start_codon:yes stop_codon:yes gene_type:complete
MTQYARPDSDVSTGSWAASTGTDFFALIDETPASDADYISSTDWDGVSPDSLTVGLSNVSDPSNAIRHIVTYRAKGTVGSGFTVPTLTVVLLQTGTTIATSVNSSLSGTYTNYTFTLSEAEANSITDYDLLRLKFTRGVEMGYGEDNFVSQAFFECDSVVTTTTTTAAPSSSDETVFESVIKSARPSSFSPINSIH